MNRHNIIQILINKINAKDYLEVGISNGATFKRINCDNKISVDPEPLAKATYTLTSDNFFAQNQNTFDVIFLDGLHHSEQLEKDIHNSLKCLNEGGYIICHDLNPLKEEHQSRPYKSGLWNGDIWKTFVKMRSERNDLRMFTIDTDHGCGIITKGSQQTINLKDEDLTFDKFNIHRNKWLNLISVEQFENEFGKNDLKAMLKEYIKKPNKPETNWNLALYYDDIGQTASAVSFYLRTAERTEDDLIKYEALIKAAHCFERQGTRRFTVKNIMKHAIAIQPKRPEGYYTLSRACETAEGDDGKWFDAYTMASIGLSVYDPKTLVPLTTSVSYPNKIYALMYQKAYAAWHCGLGEEARSIFLDLYTNYNLDDHFKNKVYESLVRLNAFSSNSLTLYDKSKHSTLKVPFKGSENIEQNYSEAYQDMFVLTLLDGKRNGSYVEIGSGHPTYGNNTLLLEKDFDWNGVSLDISEEFVNAHNNERKHTCVLKDATTVNYEAFLSGLGFDEYIDYLQIDCDPPSVSFQALISIPFETRKFGIITFEHDHYADPTGGWREKARNYLKSYGYELFASNISPDKNRPYEDWFIHPDVINMNRVHSLLNTDKTTKCAEDYIMGNLNGKAA